MLPLVTRSGLARIKYNFPQQRLETEESSVMLVVGPEDAGGAAVIIDSPGFIVFILQRPTIIFIIFDNHRTPTAGNSNSHPWGETLRPAYVACLAPAG